MRSILFFRIVLGVALLWWVSACGYQIEGTNPKLPREAASIVILPIDNQTFQNGLEAKVMKYLKQNLRNNSSVSLSSEGYADLILEVHLSQFRKEQTSISPDGLTVGQQLLLEGKVRLIDRVTQKPLWIENHLNAKAALLYEQGEDTSGVTSSTIGRGEEEAAQAFALRIYERIFYSF